MEEITAIVQGIDFSWEQGFLSQDEYLEKRRQLQEELNSLRPIDYDELTEAADLISNFNTYWHKCAELPQPEIGRQQLVKKIVDRIFAYDQRIVALVLHGDFGIVLGENEIALANVTDAIHKNLNALGIITEGRTRCGDDGLGVRPGRILFSPSNANYQPLIRHLLQQLDLPPKTPLVRQPRKKYSTTKRKQKTA